MYTSENLATRRNMPDGLIWRNLALFVLVAALLTTSLLKVEAQTVAPSQLTITISSQGMTPTSATVSAGIVHLKVKNQSGSDHLTLRISRDNGELIREINVTDKGELTIELELSAGGQYTITEAGNTSWTCSITAQAPPGGGGSTPGPVPHP